jgi:hypothetical protein
MRAGRLAEIYKAAAFQCHKTLDYSPYTIAEDGCSITCHRCGRTSYNAGDVENHYCGACKIFHDDDNAWQGDRPQQCAGLMSVLTREGADNQIMQVAQRLGHLDVAALDPNREAYDSWADVLAAHSESA